MGYSTRILLAAALLSACSDTAVTGGTDDSGAVGDTAPGGDGQARVAGPGDDAGKGPADGHDETGPSIEVLLPAEGDTLVGLAQVHIVASDPSGVASLVADIDGAALVDSNPSPDVLLALWDSLAAPDGSHKLTARAVDGQGNEAWLTVPLVSHNGAGKLVAGSVSLGRPIIGAPVRVYDRGVGGTLGQLLGESETAPDGSFAVQTDREAASGWGVVTVPGPGGTLQDPLSNEIIVMGSDDVLLAIVPLPPGEGSVVVRVHAWTTLAARLVEGLERWGTDFDEAPALALELVGKHLRRPTPIDLLLVEPAPPDGEAFVWPKPAALVGLSHLGLARMAHDRSGSILDATRLLGADLTDAVFDGNGSLDGGAGGPLKWPTTLPVSTEDSRYALALSIDAWAAEAWTTKTHPAGVTAADLGVQGGFLDTIASDDSPLYPNSGWLYDEAPPAVAWLAPTPPENAWIGPEGTLGVVALATDKSPLAAFTLKVGGVAHEATVVGSTLTAAVDLSKVDDGPLTLEVTAVDTSRGALSGGAKRKLQVDRTAPKMPPELVMPKPGGYATMNQILLAVTTTDEGSGVTVVEATPLTNCGDCAAIPLTEGGAGHWTGILPLTFEGTNGFMVRARDAAGNVAEMPWEVVRDTVAPEVVYQGSSYVDAGGLVLSSADTDGSLNWLKPLDLSLGDLCCLDAVTACSPGTCGEVLRVFPADISNGEFAPRLEVRVLDPSPAQTVLTVRYGRLEAGGIAWKATKELAILAGGTAEISLNAEYLGAEYAPQLPAATHVVQFEASDAAGNMASALTVKFKAQLVTPPLWIEDLPATDPTWELSSYRPAKENLHVPFAPTTGGADGMMGHYRIGGSRVVNPHPVPISVATWPSPVIRLDRGARRTYLKTTSQPSGCVTGTCSYLWTDLVASEEAPKDGCSIPLNFGGAETWEETGVEVHTYTTVDGGETSDTTGPSVSLTIPPKSGVTIVTHLVSGGTCALKPPRVHSFEGSATKVYLESDVDDATVPCPEGGVVTAPPGPFPPVSAMASCSADVDGLGDGLFTNPRVVTRARLASLTPETSPLSWTYWSDGGTNRTIKGPSVEALVAPANEALSDAGFYEPPLAPY